MLDLALDRFDVAEEPSAETQHGEMCCNICAGCFMALGETMLNAWLAHCEECIVRAKVVQVPKVGQAQVRLPTNRRQRRCCDVSSSTTRPNMPVGSTWLKSKSVFLTGSALIGVCRIVLRLPPK